MGHFGGGLVLFRLEPFPLGKRGCGTARSCQGRPVVGRRSEPLTAGTVLKSSRRRGGHVASGPPKMATLSPPLPSPADAARPELGKNAIAVRWIKSWSGDRRAPGSNQPTRTSDGGTQSFAVYEPTIENTSRDRWESCGQGNSPPPVTIHGETGSGGPTGWRASVFWSDEFP